MKIVVKVLSLIFCYPILSWSQLKQPNTPSISTSSNESRVVNIDFHLRPDTQSYPYLPIVVRKGQAQAQIHLHPQPGHSHIYQGSFQFDFASQFDLGQDSLEFSDPQGQKLFPSIRRTRFKDTYRLFGSVELRDRHQALLPPDDFSDPARRVTKKPLPDAELAKTSQVDLKQLEEQRKKMEEQRRLEERLQEEERLQTEMQEAQRREQLRIAQEKMSAQQRSQQRAQAQRVAQQAIEAYRTGDNSKAAQLFSQASRLDSENESYYFQYGVTLYRLEDYNRSLAVLSLAEVVGKDRVERDYYMALNHMRLREFDKALKGFQSVREEEDEILSPSAAYFEGVLLYQGEQYTQAKERFEYVLDRSQDPKLDNEAEKMIEEINRIENFLASEKEYFRLNLNLGLIYDSNILNMSKENLATDTAGYRAQYGAAMTGHFLKTRKHQWSAMLGVSDYYSLNAQFKGDATLQVADALETSFSLPYVGQFELAERSHTFMVNPSSKTLALALTGGKRSTVLTSTGILFSWNTMISGAWISDIKIDVGQDNYAMTVTDPTTDQSGSKWTLGTTQTRLLHPSGAELISVDLSLGKMNAKGTEHRQDKKNLALTYLRPGFWSSPMSVRIDFGSQAYSEALNKREDSVMSISLSQIKTFNPRWTMINSFSWSNSQSPVDLSNYNKFMLSSTVSYSLGVSRK